MNVSGEMLISLKLYRMSQAVGAGRDRLGSNLPSLCIESALAHGRPDYALPVQCFWAVESLQPVQQI